MKVYDPNELKWEQTGRYETANLYTDSGARVQVVRVPAGVALAPRYLKAGRQILCVMLTAGARLHLGTRVFRPLAGQAFECDPGEVHGVVNDTRHAFHMMVTTVGGKPDDLVCLDQSWEQYLAEHRPEAPGILSTTSNPAAL